MTIYADANCDFDSSVGVTGDVTDEADNCDTSLDATYADAIAAGSCEGERIITRTWTLVDDCGNETVQVQTITVKDEIAPTFTVPDDVTIYADANCDFDSSVGVTGDVTDEADNCDTSLDATYADAIAAGSCEGERIITRTWTLVDDCGNETVQVQTITVKDEIAPTFTVPDDVTIYADANCDFDSSVGVTGDVTDEADNCDTSLDATYADAIAAGSCEGERIITRTWTLVDDCGNETVQVQTITVKDEIAPTFTVPDDVTIYADANCDFDSSVGVTGDVTDEADNCDTSLDATYADAIAAGSCEGERIITRTWTLVDDCGNETVQVQTITVKDEIAPTFTVPDDVTIYADANCDFDSSVGVTGDVTDEADNCDTSLDATYADAIAAGSCEGERIITRTWTLVDDCGNETVQVQTITVKDEIAPTFTVPDDVTIYADANCDFDSSVGVTGDVTDEADNCDTSLDATYADAIAAGSCEGERIITRTWTLVDDCGNETVQVQTITVKDEIAPTFTVPDDVTIYADANCDFDSSVGVTGDVTDEADNCDTSLDATYADAIAAGSCEGERIITRTWTLVDDCGNETVQVQTITVKDEIAPTFTVPDDVTIYADANCDFDSSVGVTGDVTDEADNCDTSLDATYADAIAAGSCEGERIITRTWTLVDDCGNETVQVQTITVKDEIAPTFTVPDDVTIYADANCDFDSSVGVTGDVTDEADNCDTSLDATYADAIAAGSCEGERIITRTWTLVDDCGNETVQVQTITVKDEIAPTFTVPDDVTIYADANCDFDSSVGVTGDVTDEADNCDTSLDATYVDAIAAGSCEGERIITRTWTLVDDCGNETVQVQTITVKDEIAPTFTVPDDVTIYADANCDFDSSVGVTGDVTDEADNCDTSLDATYADAIAAGSCEGERIITRTWTLVDDCGNETVQVQTITVKDEIAPTFTVPDDVTIYADANCDFDSSVGVTGDVTDEADNCDTSLDATYADAIAAGSCEGERIITRTWTLVDDCGNETVQVQTITVKDEIAPTFTVPDDVTIYADANCDFDSSVGVTGDVTDEADNCDTSLDATYADAIAAGSCEGERIITRTWTLVDDCGNETVQVQTITVKDEIAPTFTVPDDVTIYADANCDFDSSVGVTGDVTDEADNCDTSLDATYADAIAAGSCEGERIITRTWTLVDDCGNETVQVQTITVKDEIAPTFTVPDDVTIYADANCDFDSSVGVTGDVTDEADNCDTSLDATYADAIAAGSCEGERIITRTWTLVDDCGNETVQVQTITVKDEIAPTFTVPDDVTIYADANCDFDSSVGVTGDVTDEADNCDTSLDATYADAIAAGSCEGERIITRTWTLVDDCGNETVQVQTITVKDEIAPTFTVPDDVTIYADANCDFDSSVGVTGDVTDEADNCDTSLDATYADAIAAGSCEGERIITRTWTLVDDCGNETVQVQTITVKDEIAPTFTVPDDVTIYADANCDFDSSVGVTGDVTDEADNCDTSLDATYADAIAAGSCEGERIITRTWTLVDDCGNETVQVQTITVKDEIAPTFTVPDDVTIYADANCDFDSSVGVTGDVTDEADNCDTSLDATYADAIAAGSCEGERIITRTWTLVDDCGNETVQVQTITVKDEIAPTFTVPDDVTIYADANCDFDSSVGVTGDVTDEADNCDTSLDATYADAIAAGSCEGERIITRTWTLVDDCGNETVQVQTITVTDVTAPELTVPDDVTVECDAVPEPGTPSAVDNCDANVILVYDGEVRIDGDCPDTYTLERTWTATDCSGNSTTSTQVIEVQDTTPPTITTEAQDASAACGLKGEKAFYEWLFNNGGAVAEDNCGDVTWSNDCPNPHGACEVTVVFTATDECGNSTNTQATFTFENEAPVIETPAMDMTVECDGMALWELHEWLSDNGGAVASDDCSDLEWTNDFDGLTNTCGDAGSVTVTFTATDECGLYAVTTATFTIEDTTDPMIVLMPEDEIVECDGLGNTTAFDDWIAEQGGAFAVDDCGDVTWTYEEIESADFCGLTSETTIRFIATDNCGNSSFADAKFIIQDTTPPALVGMPDDAEVCTGATYTFAIPTVTDDCAGGESILPGITTFPEDAQLTIDFDNGFITGIFTEPTKVTFTAEDGCGNSTEETISIFIDQTSVATVEVDQPECYDDNGEARVLVDGSVPDGNDQITIEWTGPNGFTSDQAVIGGDEFLEEGEYSVIITNVEGCVSTDSFILDRPAAISCEIDIPAFEQPVCGEHQTNVLSATVTYDASETDIVNYEWTFVDPDDLMTPVPGWYVVGDQGPEIMFAASSSPAVAILVVTDKNGCVSQCSIELEACQSAQFCSFTQGFYGGEGGIGCQLDGAIKTAGDLMQSAIPNGESQLFGVEGNMKVFELFGSEIADETIFTMMPGGGPSKALAGYATYGDLNTWNNVPIKNNGGIGNVLLSQTMALYFNIVQDSLQKPDDILALHQVVISGQYLVTATPVSCGSDQAVMGQDQYTTIPQEIINVLNDLYGGSPTIGDLYELANGFLGADQNLVDNYGNISLSSVTAAVDAINRGFDECRILIGFTNSDPEQGSRNDPEFAGTIDAENIDVKLAARGSTIDLNAYPNPFTTKATIKFVVTEKTHAVLQVYNLNGMEVQKLFDGTAEAGEVYEAKFDATALPKGMYIYRLVTEHETAVGSLVPKDRK